ncbi:hypothetical protein Mapa_000596 [Marchantia paleacea]|nr:hypothetical protein Mapa_000596 [Marchantia paleacea]
MNQNWILIVQFQSECTQGIQKWRIRLTECTIYNGFLLIRAGAVSSTNSSYFFSNRDLYSSGNNLAKVTTCSYRDELIVAAVPD